MQHGRKAIHVAAMTGRQNVIHALVERWGVDVNMRTGGSTPLGAAVGGGHMATVRILLELGADADIPSKVRDRKISFAQLHIVIMLCMVDARALQSFGVASVAT